MGGGTPARSGQGVLQSGPHGGYFSQVWMGVPQPGQERGYPGQVKRGVPQPGMGYPCPGMGYPQDRTADGIRDTRRAVCLLHSRRRTFLFFLVLDNWVTGPIDTLKSIHNNHNTVWDNRTYSLITKKHFLLPCWRWIFRKSSFFVCNIIIISLLFARFYFDYNRHGLRAHLPNCGKNAMDGLKFLTCGKLSP